MTKEELIKNIQDNIEDGAEMDFLLIDSQHPMFMKIYSITMNADIDDPRNYHRGGIVFFPIEMEY